MTGASALAMPAHRPSEAPPPGAGVPPAAAHTVVAPRENRAVRRAGPCPPTGTGCGAAERTGRRAAPPTAGCAALACGTAVRRAGAALACARGATATGVVSTAVEAISLSSYPLATTP
jgi:hypothetical protein